MVGCALAQPCRQRRSRRDDAPRHALAPPLVPAAFLAALIAALITSPLASTSAHAQVVLEFSEAPVDATVFHAEGFDRHAPRPLVLWRFDGEAAQRIAETRSLPGGRFDFGVVPLPLLHAEFAVTGRDEPVPTTRRLFRPVERAVPRPVVVAHDEADDRLAVQTARSDGELEVSDAATGRLLARVAVEASRMGTTGIALAAALPNERPAQIAIVHVLPDARRSAPEIWRLAR